MPGPMFGPAPGPTRTVLGCVVEEGPTPPPWPAPVDSTRVLADHDRALLHHDLASLYVAHGRDVVVSAPDEATRLEHDYLVYAHALRLLLFQQQRFPLHATLVESPAGQVVGITGATTAGKTTTAVELVTRGWRLVCDDIVEARIEDGGVVAVPHPRPVHLADGSARRLGLDPEVGRLLPAGDRRVYAGPDDSTPRRLSALVRLEVVADGRVSLDPSTTVHAVPWLAARTDLDGICDLPEHRAAFLSWLCGVAAAVPMVHLRRPEQPDSVASVGDAIEDWVSAHDSPAR